MTNVHVLPCSDHSLLAFGGTVPKMASLVASTPYWSITSFKKNKPIHAGLKSYTQGII